jgi:restriction system protein
MGKKEELAALLALRRLETHPTYISLSQYEDGFYDLDFVSPWTAGAQNIDAALMIIGQDWISEKYLENRAPEMRLTLKEMGQDPMLPTNKHLKKLLKEHFDLRFSDTYATNMSVFIKLGNMDADVPRKDLEDFARKFTLPLIRAVQPSMVLCLGERTFNALRRANNQPRMKWSDACLPTAHTRAEGAEVYGVPHTGSWGSKNAGGDVRMSEIWTSLAQRFQKLNTLAASGTAVVG